MPSFERGSTGGARPTLLGVLLLCLLLAACSSAKEKTQTDRRATREVERLERGNLARTPNPDQLATREARRTESPPTREAQGPAAAETREASRQGTPTPIPLPAVLPTPRPTSTRPPESPVAAAGAASEVAGLKKVRGLFSITKHNAPAAPGVLDNPSVDGIVVRTFWPDVQPSNGQFRWDFLDGQVQAAESHGKKAVLIVLSGASTPDWALEGVQSADFISKYGFSRGDQLRLPLPWDQTYLGRWFGFVKALGQRYDQRPAVVLSQATGPTSISAEMSLPNDDASVAQWRTLGYTPEKFLGAWDQTLRTYVEAFPHTQVGLILYPGLPIPDRTASDKTRQDAVALATDKYGSRVALQTSGLSARKEEQPRLGYQLLKQNAARTTVGFEMGTSATERPDRMGNPDPVKALRNSIDFGLAAGAQYLIVYEKDVVNPAMQDTLRYAHTALAK
ncbi:MAG TPA: hypothetical protein VFC93_06130 [Chloroflexota bacterium]|nr:hypothetical protein [Chloroflexota bacterium]